MKRVVIAVVALATLSVIALAIFAAIYLPRYVRTRVIAEADARGVQLEPGPISFRWGLVRVTDSKLTLPGVQSLEAKVRTLRVTLDGLEPKDISVEGVDVEVTGDPLRLSQELRTWMRGRGAALSKPLSIAPYSFTLRTAPKAEPVLVLSEGKLDYAPKRAVITANRARVLGRELGALRLSQRDDLISAELSLGLSALENPVFTIEARDTTDQKVHVALAPVAIEKLNQRFGLHLPHPEVEVSGTLDAEIPRNLIVGRPIQGRVDGELRGYLPPHPVELDGFVFGDTTQFSTQFSLELGRLSARLEEAKVRAGKFELSGEGVVRAEPDHVRLLLSLEGTLPCAALAGAAAESRLGRALGRVAGKAARRVVGGTVGVQVSVDAWLDELEEARVARRISPGCGLRPLSVAELIALGELVPEAMDRAVLDDLGKIVQKEMDKLPGKPIQLPDLGQLGLPDLLRPFAPSPEADAPAPADSAAP